jgi:predicted  nucleic acid-binding Zn-ribbon protein
MSIDEEITRLESLLEVAYASYEEALRAQSYSISGGGNSQSLARQTVDSLRKEIKGIKNDISDLNRQKSGKSGFKFYQIKVK